MTAKKMKVNPKTTLSPKMAKTVAKIVIPGQGNIMKQFAALLKATQDIK